MDVPRHVAIILDGNGRWAKSRKMPRNYGHVRGAANVETICRAADDMGIQYLTVYLFSTENWRRNPEEVTSLMKLFHSYTRTCIRQARENNMRCRVIGDPTALDAQLQASLRELVESSKNNTGLNFQLALNYGSRDEIVRAVRRTAEAYRDGSIHSLDEITEDSFSAMLDRPGYGRYSGPGSSDPDSGGAAAEQLSAVAAGLRRALLYRCPVAGLL